MGSERRTALEDRLILEAQCHAQEARTANATISEIYQICTGATGEPGNWHAAEPVRAALSQAHERGRAEGVEEAAKVAESYALKSPDAMRLQGGEMTAQEIRTAKAFMSAATGAIRALDKRRD